MPTRTNTTPALSTFLVHLSVLSIPGVYVALVVSCLLSVALGAGFVYGAYRILSLFIVPGEVHYAPIKLSVALVFVILGVTCGVLIGIWSTVRGFFATLRNTERAREPGVTIRLEENEKLDQLIDEVRRLVGAKKPRNVVLSFDPTFAVTTGKVGLLFEEVHGRTLILGAPLLSILTVAELRAVISHEMAHFSGHDLTYTSFVAPTYKALFATGEGFSSYLLAEVEEDDFGFWRMVPLFISAFFLGSYLWVFHRLDLAIRRQREMRADALAVEVCGDAVFRKMLSKIVACDSFFATAFHKRFHERIMEGKEPSNYCDEFRRMVEQSKSTLNTILASRLKEEENARDTHPSLKKRLDSAQKTVAAPEGGGLARNLLEKPEAYEKALTKYYLKHFRGPARRPSSPR